MSQIALDHPDVLPKVLPNSECVRVGPFELGWAALASGLIPLSLIWDFSWESTIGVDLFWSPPHLATHVGVFLCGTLGLYLVVRFTLARRRGWNVGVNIGGLCAPAGGWLLLWGALVMLAAIPLDKWWQAAYGLGAGLWPPPQILKTISFFSVICGGWFLCASVHESNGRLCVWSERVANWQGGLLLVMCGVVLITSNYPNWQHSAKFYKVSCAIYPAILIAFAISSKRPWGATRAALVYTIIGCFAVWLLPLFPARPLTAPIHNPMTHMMPPPFPLLLVAPAVVIDLLVKKFQVPEIFFVTSRKSRLLVQLAQSLVSGALFLVTFLLVQWYFAKFLLSASADNWLFAGGGKHWPFFLKIDEARVMFWGTKQDSLPWTAILTATILATVSVAFGRTVGEWVNRLRR